jgi:hypothetical protein
MMVRVFVRHDVEDYAAWRKAYDAFDATRKRLGVKAQAVFQNIDDPNDITVWHEVESLEAARAFTSSEELKTAMKSAGVAGTPLIWFTKEV